jgi:hypothetical protein
MITQLEYDGYTDNQANYGATAATDSGTDHTVPVHIIDNGNTMF